MMALILEIFQTVCFCITCVILVLCQNRLFSMWREMRAELFLLRKRIYRERRSGSYLPDHEHTKYLKLERERLREKS